MRHSLAFAAAVALFGLASAAQANPLVTNGDFESPANSTQGTLPAGWTVGGNGNIGLYTGTEYLGCCSIHDGTPAQFANQFASFGPGNKPSGTLSQTLNLAAGNYVLSFDQGAFGGGSQSLSATLLGAVGTPSTDNVALADDDLSTTYHLHSLDFTSTGAPVTLLFQATSGGTDDDVDVILDNVSITAAPEPATWMSLLLGVAAIGGGLRAARRKGGPQLAST